MNANVKKELRRAVLKERQAISRDDVEKKSAAICARISGLDTFCQAKTVMLYLPFRNEVDTKPLIEKLWAAGKRVLVPVCQPVDISLIPCQINQLADLQPGTWGILEPKPECLLPVPVDEIDLVLVPGVAFDPQGTRLGYGGGYYDRFLPRLKPGTPVVAVAFAMQMLPKLASDSFDQPMDMVVTESGVYPNPQN